MSGKPAARMGDMAMDCADPVDAPTGTVIAAGTVLIEGMPAAKQNDQVVGVDVHIVMIPSPAGPVPTPLPHPFAGMLDGDLESSVKIMGMPAAVLGSTASCQPPHIPQGGPFQKPPANKAKIIKGATTVFIGSGDGKDKSTSGDSAATCIQTDAGDYFSVSFQGQRSPFQSFVRGESQEADPSEDHFLDVTFVDNGKRPVAGNAYCVQDADSEESSGFLSDGLIQRRQKSEGSADIELKAIVEAKWKTTTELEVGATVELQAKTSGLEDGLLAVFEIWERDIERADKKIAVLVEDLRGEAATATWTYPKPPVDEEPIMTAARVPDAHYSKPDYFFIVQVAGMWRRSDFLQVTDTLEIELCEEGGHPIADAAYTLRLSTGETRKGTFDRQGRTTESELTPRPLILELDGTGTVSSASESSKEDNRDTKDDAGEEQNRATTPGSKNEQSADEDSASEERRGPVRVRLVGMFFDTSKCFLLPSAMAGIRQVKQAYDKSKNGEVLVVGHTDTSGKDAYNLVLSTERADAIGAYLKDDVEAWYAWYSGKKPKDKQWGVREDQHMLSALPEGGTPYYAGSVSGKKDDKHLQAVEAFQEAAGLTVDGDAGPKTRKELIRRYMALDETSLPAACQLVTHGCGEYFPEIEAADGQQSPEDRRVEIFVFDGPITPPPPGKTSQKGSKEYPQWWESVVRTVDVTDVTSEDFLTIGLANPYSYDAAMEMHLRVIDNQSNDNIIPGKLDENSFWVFRIQNVKKDVLYDISLRCSTNGKECLCFEQIDLHQYNEILKSGDTRGYAMPRNLVADWQIIDDPLEDGVSIDRPDEEGEPPPLASYPKV